VAKRCRTSPKAVDEDGSDDISVSTDRAIRNGSHETDTQVERVPYDGAEGHERRPLGDLMLSLVTG
jgi:hypothetical protein